MDRKVGAALAVAIIGVVVGVVGIFMAKDAKDSNADTQAQLTKAIQEADSSTASKEARAVAALKLVGDKVKKNAAASESKDSSELSADQKKDAAATQQDANSVAALSSKVEELTQEISDVEGKQQSNTAKVNARIDSLEGRIDG